MNTDGWKWYGKSGHFICGEWCRFHMCTVVGSGKYLVSTVGEYIPEREVRRILMDCRGDKVGSVLRGDEADRHYYEHYKCEDLGYNRKYETMAFKVKGSCDCGCGQPNGDGLDIDLAGYNDPVSTNAGHMAMCAKWDSQP